MQVNFQCVSGTVSTELETLTFFVLQILSPCQASSCKPFPASAPFGVGCEPCLGFNSECPNFNSAQLSGIEVQISPRPSQTSCHIIQNIFEGDPYPFRLKPGAISAWLRCLLFSARCQCRLCKRPNELLCVCFWIWLAEIVSR